LLSHGCSSARLLTRALYDRFLPRGKDIYLLEGPFPPIYQGQKREARADVGVRVRRIVVAVEVPQTRLARVVPVAAAVEHNATQADQRRKSGDICPVFTSLICEGECAPPRAPP